MDDRTAIREILLELSEISREIDGIFRKVHSLASLVKGLGAGTDLSEYATRLGYLEGRVHSVGATFYDESIQKVIDGLRLERAFWCEVMVATSALADWSNKAHMELDLGVSYDGSERQQTLRLFLRSVKTAKGLWTRLTSISPDLEDRGN